VKKQNILFWIGIFPLLSLLCGIILLIFEIYQDIAIVLVVIGLTPILIGLTWALYQVEKEDTETEKSNDIKRMIHTDRKKQMLKDLKQQEKKENHIE